MTLHKHNQLHWCPVFFAVPPAQNINIFHVINSVSEWISSLLHLHLYGNLHFFIKMGVEVYTFKKLLISLRSSSFPRNIWNLWQYMGLYWLCHYYAFYLFKSDVIAAFNSVLEGMITHGLFITIWYCWKQIKHAISCSECCIWAWNVFGWQHNHNCSIKHLLTGVMSCLVISVPGVATKASLACRQSE